MSTRNKKPIERTKKLKKVEDLEINLNSRLDALNTAYQNKNGSEIDKANKDLFEYLDSLNIPKENEFYTRIRNHTWQRNHLKILAFISSLMQENNRMPTNTELSISCGLSEETIYKHLREFKDHDLYKHEEDKFKFMVHRILTTVFNLGVQGNIRACKAFLEYHKPETKKTFIKDQNNYIQINGTIINQDTLKHLNTEQLNSIENILKLAVPN